MCKVILFYMYFIIPLLKLYYAIINTSQDIDIYYKYNLAIYLGHESMLTSTGDQKSNNKFTIEPKNEQQIITLDRQVSLRIPRRAPDTWSRTTPRWSATVRYRFFSRLLYLELGSSDDPVQPKPLEGEWFITVKNCDKYDPAVTGTVSQFNYLRLNR